MEKKIMWAVFEPNGLTRFMSLRYTRKECIKDFLYGSSMSWKETKRYGWTVKKVEVTIKPKP
jgi:hypothetical protein